MEADRGASSDTEQEAAIQVEKSWGDSTISGGRPTLGVKMLPSVTRSRSCG